jgi:hypothetical protein
MERQMSLNQRTPNPRDVGLCIAIHTPQESLHSKMFHPNEDGNVEKDQLQTLPFLWLEIKVRRVCVIKLSDSGVEIHDLFTGGVWTRIYEEPPLGD